MTFRTPRARAAVATFAITLPLYLVTMSRAIGFIDRGELAAAAATLGIPHATGYPTLMLLAGALVHLSPLRPVVTLNALAAALTAIGAALLALLCDRTLGATAPRMAERSRAALAALAALIAAFTATWWQQANGFEVYALHTVAMPLVVLLAVRWLEAAQAEDAHPEARRAAGRAGFAFALATGLSFTNHLTTVLLAPGLLALALRRLGGRRFAAWLPALMLPFLLGLLPELWLPIRSRMQPRLDWGDPETLRAFVHHVTGGDYRGWMFSDLGAMADQARYLLWRLPWDFAWLGLVAAALGVLALARRSGALAAMALLFVGAGAVFATGYRIADPDAYLLTTVLGLAILTAAGLGHLSERFGVRAALAAAMALLAANLALHARESDESGNRMVESFVHDLLGPLPPRAVMITAAWDVVQSGTLYYQEVEGFRRDVLVVNPELTRVSWYLTELERRSPELVERAGETFPRYRAALRAVERGGPYRSAEIEGARRAFLDAFVAGASRDREVFSTSGLPEVSRSWRRVPWHLALALRRDTSYVSEPPWRYSMRPWTQRLDHYVARACWAYGEARLQRARYEAEHGRVAGARAIAASAAAFDPAIRPERVGPLPLGQQRVVLETAAFYRELRGMLAAAGLAAASPR